MTDPAQDIVQHMNEAETTRRRDLLEGAATEQRWLDASVASRVIPTDDIATMGDAARAVHAYTQAHPEHAKPAEATPITPEEQERRWGEEVLNGLLGGGR